jgi:hypothetical protein
MSVTIGCCSIYTNLMSSVFGRTKCSVIETQTYTEKKQDQRQIKIDISKSGCVIHVALNLLVISLCCVLSRPLNVGLFGAHLP